MKCSLSFSFLQKPACGEFIYAGVRFLFSKEYFSLFYSRLHAVRGCQWSACTGAFSAVCELDMVFISIRAVCSCFASQKRKHALAWTQARCGNSPYRIFADETVLLARSVVPFLILRVRLLVSPVTYRRAKDDGTQGEPEQTATEYRE